MKSAVSIRQQILVCIGKAGTPVGTLIYVKQWRREKLSRDTGRILRWLLSEGASGKAVTRHACPRGLLLIVQQINCHSAFMCLTITGEAYSYISYAMTLCFLNMK
ncbi:hypothetical protein RS584_14900 [Enterobacter sp. DTU_2021_1002640_1_SI_PRY_ASU_LCPMC_013]|uniref:hypothetical protein n=1 Tax=Enterobacter sp. DTU_2021_1002640_1_SI_PRY_ASU_LCPMC_013 TaxID=3077940 RepID=UPI0028ED1367|nr:hypothetical protein [Enterobacter sp. DTU_2021_1002640_1_SI_PRY_ASU_LCPMC_013]WNU99002.1 hypothetical protein RS584_14900 [Enterobacter sp. DTU_2021_1002640_1_SI_PRY_ASU_LCPMC_013]